MSRVLFRRGVRQCIDLTYATAARQTIWEYAPRSRAAEDYLALIDFLDPESHSVREAHDEKEAAAVVHPADH
jgi:hypothetical protein